MFLSLSQSLSPRAALGPYLNTLPAADLRERSQSRWLKTRMCDSDCFSTYTPCTDSHRPVNNLANTLNCFSSPRPLFLPIACTRTWVWAVGNCWFAHCFLSALLLILVLENGCLGYVSQLPPPPRKPRNCLTLCRTQAPPVICKSVSVHEATEVAMCMGITKDVIVSPKIHACTNKLLTRDKQIGSFTQLLLSTQLCVSLTCPPMPGRECFQVGNRN